MNTKIMITAALITASSAVFAATPKELADAGDWHGLIRCGYAALTNSMPKDKAADIANTAIAMSNSWIVAYFVKDGIITADDAYAKLIPVLPRKDVAYAAWNIVCPNKDSAKGLEILETLIGTNDMPIGWVAGCLSWCMWNGCNEAEFLRLSTKAIELKDYCAATAPFKYTKSEPQWTLIESAELKAWRAANFEKVATEAVAIAKTKPDRSAYYVYNCILFFASITDLHANDTASTQAMKWFDAAMFNDSNIPLYNGRYLANYKLGQEMLNAYIKNANDAGAIYEFIQTKLTKFDKASGIAALKNAWYKLGKDKKTALKTALYLNDVDKVIDSLLLTTDGITPEQLDAVIPLVNGVDADYRTTDIVRVLKNINAKYTLKLYDDRDTWEPLLSKVRAMIDAR